LGYLWGINPGWGSALQEQRKLLAEVQELYERALERGGDEALRGLQQLVDSRHSGAACLALAKVRPAGPSIFLW
jgi:hypothetical protein